MEKNSETLEPRESIWSQGEMRQFIHVMSHDLMEPVRIITIYTQLLEDSLRDRLDSETRRYIRYSVEGALRLHHLLSDLSDYAHVGVRSRERARVDLNKALNQALTNLKFALPAAGARVESGLLPEIQADPVHMVLLFQALVGNALKFRNPEFCDIQIMARRRRGDWVVSVRDNGIGIESQYFSKIFEMFERLHDRERYPGMGMGLSLCKKIVKQAGGGIWVESELGKGSSFHFSLPAKEAV